MVINNYPIDKIVFFAHLGIIRYKEYWHNLCNISKKVGSLIILVIREVGRSGLKCAGHGKQTAACSMIYRTYKRTENI